MSDDSYLDMRPMYDVLVNDNNALRAEVGRLTRERDALREAARAVVAEWDANPDGRITATFGLLLAALGER